MYKKFFKISLVTTNFHNKLLVKKYPLQKIYGDFVYKYLQRLHTCLTILLFHAIYQQASKIFHLFFWTVTKLHLSFASCIKREETLDLD